LIKNPCVTPVKFVGLMLLLQQKKLFRKNGKALLLRLQKLFKKMLFALE